MLHSNYSIMKATKTIQYIFFLSLFILGSCNKMLEFEPDARESILLTDALQTPDDMQGLLISCYDVMTNGYYGRQQTLSELLSDNLNAPYDNADFNEVYIRNTIIFNGTIQNFYKEPYIAIYRCNVLLENFDLIDGLSNEDRIRIEAEAKFIRACNHFELVNLFAQPYTPNGSNDQLGIVLKVNSSFDPIPRATVGAVYGSIIGDLEYAAENLPLNNGIYADQNAANAMLARVYFQMNNFEKAAEYATLAIDNGSYNIGTEFDRWSENISSENIFTLVVQQADGRSNGFGSYRSDAVDLPTLAASSEYFNLLYGTGADANPSDLRKNWFELRQIGTVPEFYAVSKFNADFFVLPYLHLTETLLIRAESLAELGSDLSQAISDINEIRSRAQIGFLADNSSAIDIINAARIERKKEMFGEGRWVMDQKRQGVLGDLELIRGVPYDCNGMVLQFPSSENTSNFINNPSGGCN
jgi:hypothetical protein